MYRSPGLRVPTAGQQLHTSCSVQGTQAARPPTPRRPHPSHDRAAAAHLLQRAGDQGRETLHAVQGSAHPAP